MSEGKVKRKIIFLIFAAVMVVAGGCGTDGGDTEASRDLFAMDTYMTVTAYGKGATEAVDQAADEISRLDQLLSTGNEDSEIIKSIRAEMEYSRRRQHIWWNAHWICMKLQMVHLILRFIRL